MKVKFLAVPLITVFCLCISATQTISKKSNASLISENGVVMLTDTVKVIEEASDSLALEITETWREWRTVENHTFGKDRGSLPMIADLRSLHPYFRDKISALIRNCKARGINLEVVESYRTHAKQSEYYGMGRKYTRSAGGKSKHQYGLAVDLVPVVKGVAVWENETLWKKIGYEGEKLGLRWGGRWKSPYDPAHFEWSGGLTTYQLSAGYLPKIPAPASNNYPCLDEDVRELKKHWEVWEELQLAARRNKRQPRLTSSRANP
jgi:hypothetical protein